MTTHRIAKPTRTMRDQPDLDQLKRQARELLNAFREGDTAAVDEVNTHYRDAQANAFKLSDAQLVIARAYGYESWPRLKQYVDGVTITRLVERIAQGDRDGTAAMLRQRPDLINMDLSSSNERKPLHAAVLHHHPEIVRDLMRAGANPHVGIYPHRDATTAFILANDRGYDDIVAIIKKEEAARQEDLNCPNVEVTPEHEQLNAHIAAWRNDEAIALIEANADLVRVCDGNGQTPLHHACAAKNAGMIEWLLDHDADPRKLDAGGHAPLDLLVTGVDPRQPDRATNAQAAAALFMSRGVELTLRAAVAMGDIQRVDDIIARKAEPFPGPIHWVTGGLLALAVIHKQHGMLEHLLSLGLDPDERTPVDNTEPPQFSDGAPLWYASLANDGTAARILLANKADPNANVYASGTPVDNAYTIESDSMKKLLFDHGGRPMVHTIGLQRDVDAAVALLRERDPKGPYDAYGGDTLAEQLLWAGACGGEPTITRMALEHIDRALDDPWWLMMLEQPLRFWGHSNNPQRYPREDYLRCFRLLIEHGVDVNVVRHHGYNILHDLASLSAPRRAMTDSEQVAFAAALIEGGIRFDQRDYLLESTPLAWACRWGATNLCAYLLDAGAPPHEDGAKPWATPMAWAKRYEHPDIVDVLIAYGG